LFPLQPSNYIVQKLRTRWTRSVVQRQLELILKALRRGDMFA
jgi:hypothetical protein